MKKRPSLPSYMLQGAIALLPVGVAVGVLVVLFKFVEQRLDSVLVFLPEHLRGNRLVVAGAELGVIALICSALIVWGMLVRTLVGRAFTRVTEKIVGAIPGVNTVYHATRQIIDVFALDKERFFARPVLVEYPSPGIWMVAFSTGEMQGTHLPLDDDEVYSTVFIPTTPNPTSGYLAVVPRSKVRALNMSTEDAVKMVLTGGVVKANGIRQATPS
jgi:uncharacterized membrane protein